MKWSIVAPFRCIALPANHRAAVGRVKQHLALTFFFAAAIVVAGCASRQPAPSLPISGPQAKLYVFNTTKPLAQVDALSLYDCVAGCEGFDPFGPSPGYVRLAKVRNQHYAMVPLSSGKHVLSAIPHGRRTYDIKLDAKPGETYYVSMWWMTQQGFLNTYGIIPVSADWSDWRQISNDEARRLMQTLTSTVSD